MIRSAPGFGAATLSVARFAFVRHTKSRRTVIAIVALGIVLLAVGGARVFGHQPADESWKSAVDTLLTFACYAVPFLFHANSFSEEHADRTLTYLLIRPVSRASIVLGKFLAGSLFVVTLDAVATVLLFVAAYAAAFDAADFSSLWKTILAVKLLGVGHSAIAAAWSAVVPEHATPATVVHFAIGELGLRHLPSVVPLLSMHHHATEIAGVDRGSWADSAPTLPMIASVGAIVVLSLAYLAFAVVVASAREYRFARA